MDKIEEFVDCNLNNWYILPMFSKSGIGYGEEPNPLADFFGIGEGKGREFSNNIDNGSGSGCGMGMSSHCIRYLEKRLIQ